MTIPIPHRPSGFLLGDSSANVTIDAFVDIQCAHSLAMWPTLMNVLVHFKNKSLSLKVHLMTLSDHRQAWDVSLGLLAFADSDATKFYDFATFLYERQEQFNNASFSNKTHDDLKRLVADFAEEFSTVKGAEFDRKRFLEKMGSHDTYIQGRTPIRYAATRSVWATPTVFINNAGKVPVNHHSKLADWLEVIEPLL